MQNTEQLVKSRPTCKIAEVDEFGMHDGIISKSAECDKLPKKHSHPCFSTKHSVGVAALINL